MLTVLLYALLAIALAGGLFLLATRFLPAGEQIAPPLRDEPPWELPPDRALRGDDIDAVRLPVSLRGYRFAETDLLLDRLAAELRARDAEIARLRGQPLPPQPHHYAADASAYARPDDRDARPDDGDGDARPNHDEARADAADTADEVETYDGYAPPYGQTMPSHDPEYRPEYANPRVSPRPYAQHDTGSSDDGDAAHGDAAHGDAAHGGPGRHDDGR